MVLVDGVPVAAGGHALTFEVADGRCAGVLGSTESVLEQFAETMAGVRRPVAGRILIDDLDVRSDAGGRSQVSMFLPRAAHRLTTLAEHLATVARSRGALRCTVPEAIERLGLTPRARLNTPSMQSAAALAAALMPDSRLVVLHQPFTALDAAARHRAVEWIRALSQTRASIIVTGTAEGDVRAISHQVIDAGAGR